MADWTYKMLDHRWNNFKTWSEAMYKIKDKPVMTVQSLMDMIKTIDAMSDKENDIVWEALKPKESNNDNN